MQSKGGNEYCEVPLSRYLYLYYNRSRVEEPLFCVLVYCTDTTPMLYTTPRGTSLPLFHRSSTHSTSKPNPATHPTTIPPSREHSLAFEPCPSMSRHVWFTVVVNGPSDLAPVGVGVVT